jgi:hypothetical protein
MTEGRSNCHRIERERSHQDLLDDEPFHSVAARTVFSIAALHRHDCCHVGTARVEQNETKVATDVESSLKVLGVGHSRKDRAANQLQHLCSRNVSERSPERSSIRINGLQLAFAACSGLFHLAPEASRCFKTLKRRTKKLQAATTKLLMFRYFNSARGKSR